MLHFHRCFWVIARGWLHWWPQKHRIGFSVLFQWHCPTWICAILISHGRLQWALSSKNHTVPRLITWKLKINTCAVKPLEIKVQCSPLHISLACFPQGVLCIMLGWSKLLLLHRAEKHEAHAVFYERLTLKNISLGTSSGTWCKFGLTAHCCLPCSKLATLYSWAIITLHPLLAKSPSS